MTAIKLFFGSLVVTLNLLQGLKYEKHGIKAIEKFIETSVYAITHEPNSCLAIKTTFEMAIDDPEVQKIIKADSNFTYNLILQLVENAIEKNEIAISNDAKMLTDYIINNFTGWHESYIIYKDKERIEKMAKFLLTQIKS